MALICSSLNPSFSASISHFCSSFTENAVILLSEREPTMKKWRYKLLSKLVSIYKYYLFFTVNGKQLCKSQLDNKIFFIFYIGHIIYFINMTKALVRLVTTIGKRHQEGVCFFSKTFLRNLFQGLQYSYSLKVSHKHMQK